ncbi:hypothetical protein PHMEG_000419 [Phytophthora megakarya]|uniref:Uncharacterized protein n=1 Tax=Phytophthora megakarya TaxID=4795 RepID=A0A225X5J5_9STRA|nr:hypothetical protein PHMEG_000419 [Phytophthora megakarya]
MQESAYPCSVLVQKVANAISIACCLSKKPNPRDEIKILRGSTAAQDRPRELRWGIQAAEGDEDDGGPGSGDDDVLTSLGASYRAWRVYHREKRAHDYTKSRLVDVIRREAALEKQLVRIGGSVESSECTLMKLEDLEAGMAILEGKYNAAVTEQVAREEIAFEFEAFRTQFQNHIERLHTAEADALHWKAQYQAVLPKLARINMEKQSLLEELRMAKKACVLKMNRQYAQLER